MKRDTRLWYMAHPVMSDDRFTMGDNLTHATHMMGLLMRAGLPVVAPYISCCAALDDTIEQERKWGMEMDIMVLERCDGIVLVGHKISNGMAAECQTMERLGKAVFDLTRKTDEEVKSWVKTYLQVLEEEQAIEQGG